MMTTISQFFVWIFMYFIPKAMPKIGEAIIIISIIQSVHVIATLSKPLHFLLNDIINRIGHEIASIEKINRTTFSWRKRIQNKIHFMQHVLRWTHTKKINTINSQPNNQIVSIVQYIYVARFYWIRGHTDIW